MAIVEARSWEEFLSPDCEIPHDVHFLTRREGEGDEKLIGAHKVLLADVSPVFREIFLKETREVIEVRDTTHEAFNTMIRYIYKPPGSAFFPAVHQDGEEKLNQNAIDCPLKFFDLLYLAEKYNLKSLQWDLTSQVVDIAITENNVILATTVAKKYQGMLPFDETSTEMLAKCLKFLLEETDRETSEEKSREARDLWTQFWALVNKSGEGEVISLKERLAGTPFVNMEVCPAFTKASLGRSSYQNCLYLACTGLHVR